MEDESVRNAKLPAELDERLIALMPTRALRVHNACSARIEYVVRDWIAKMGGAADAPIPPRPDIEADSAAQQSLREPQR